MAIYFDPDIKAILAPGLRCMAGVNAATEEGMIPVELDDYETVKLLAPRILTRLRGVNEDGQVVPQMPPDGPLPDEEIEAVAQWIEDGMPEKAPG